MPHQVQQMIKLLLGLDQPRSPHDAADALAVAICHLHSVPGYAGVDPKIPGYEDARSSRRPQPRTWRQYRPPTTG